MGLIRFAKGRFASPFFYFLARNDMEQNICSIGILDIYHKYIQEFYDRKKPEEASNAKHDCQTVGWQTVFDPINIQKDYLFGSRFIL